MARNKSGGSSRPVESIETLVGRNTELTGGISFTGGLRVDGTVNGDIVARGDENSTLVLSESGTVNGTIDVPHAVINGQVTGGVRSSVRLELQPASRVEGDVVYRSIQMQMGARVNGTMTCEDQEAELKSTGNDPILKAIDGGAATSDANS